MIRLYPDQLDAQLQESLRPCYLLFGNDLLLLQESQDRICDRAQAQKFREHFGVTLEVGTNWDTIFSLCQSLSLFASRKTLLLILPDGNIPAIIGEKLLQLASFLHEDLLLILRGSKLTYAQENSAWFKVLSQSAVLVSCATPEQDRLPHWVATRARKMKLLLDDDAYQPLCYYYEGNLLALLQALKRLSLIYPDGRLTLARVETVVNDDAHFTSFHWIDATLAGKSKRAAHVLRQLKLQASEPVILLRNIQREVILLLTLKRQTVDIPTRTLFDQYKVRQNRRPLLTQALKRITLTQLRDSVSLMIKIELSLKQDYGYPVWSGLDALSLLLCDKKLPAAMINE
ncbi:MAG: DNA polymerase III subunit delta [Sodalis sp. Psp]|nr:DNA polymerase III subunit delta [Sodalis sp. Psp]MCR3757090.1 DNA polymerase III subunit delta [Sodalis sp. Ppy]